MLRLRNVSFHGPDRPELTGIDLDIDPGSVTVLLGPDGAETEALLGVIGGELALAGGAIDDDARPWLRVEGAARAGSQALVASLTPRDAAGDVASLAPYAIVRAEPELPGRLGARATERDRACATLAAATRLAKRGIGVIAAIRDLDLIAAFADRVVLLRDGGIVAEGDPRFVLNPNFVRLVFGPRGEPGTLAT